MQKHLHTKWCTIFTKVSFQFLLTAPKKEWYNISHSRTFKHAYGNKLFLHQKLIYFHPWIRKENVYLNILSIDLHNIYLYCDQDLWPLSFIEKLNFKLVDLNVYIHWCMVQKCLEGKVLTLYLSNWSFITERYISLPSIPVIIRRTTQQYCYSEQQCLYNNHIITIKHEWDIFNKRL